MWIRQKVYFTLVCLWIIALFIIGTLVSIRMMMTFMGIGLCISMAIMCFEVWKSD